MRQHRQRGMSLIEVMIALLLLSFGLMGMLGLKVAGLRHAGLSNARAAASMHAAEITDRMRANPMRAESGQYALTLDAAAPAIDSDSTVAQIDLAQWRRNIASNLRGGTGSVVVDAGGAVRVVLQWSERIEQATEPQTLAFIFDTRL